MKLEPDVGRGLREVFVQRADWLVSTSLIRKYQVWMQDLVCNDHMGDVRVQGRDVWAVLAIIPGGRCMEWCV